MPLISHLAACRARKWQGLTGLSAHEQWPSCLKEVGFWQVGLDLHLADVAMSGLPR